MALKVLTPQEVQRLGLNQGPKGPKGDKGDKGDAGLPGIDGVDGVSIVGEQGPQGEPGRPGRDGIDGAPGKDGKEGDKGDKGDKPEHEWRGTLLRFEQPDGEWGKFVDLRGRDGLGQGGVGGGAILNDELKRLSKVQGKVFSYNADKTVATITDEDGRVTTFTYNPDKTVDTIDNQDNLKTFSYNPDKTVAEITVTA